MIQRFFAVVFALVLAAPAAAFDASATAEAVIKAWDGWMDRHKVPAGAIILSYQGEVIAEHGRKRSVDDAVTVASLSKAITAVCAARAAETAGKSINAPMAEVIPAALAEHAPRDDKFAAITLAHLITHTSGLDTDYHRAELPKLRSFEKENKLWQFSKVSALELSGAPGSASYRYSNANYLVLGLAIEEMTGEPYETYCQREVLAPVGADSGQLSQKWRVMTSWGGWEISARDYLKFAEANFTGRNAADRVQGLPMSVPYVNDRGTRYGLGMHYRRNSAGLNAWHNGSWTGVKGRVTDRYGAYVAVYGNGLTVVTNYAHDAWNRDVIGDLENRLWEATHP